MAKTLQDRMNDMKPYFRGIEMYNEAIMLKVVFPNKWKVYPSEDGKIKVTASDNGEMTYYYADSNNTTYEEIFNLAEETIKVNQDIILKLKLLKDKVEELKELFQATSYDDLLKLEFVIGSKKARKKTPKKKKIEEEPKEDVKNIVENNDENETTVNNE